MKEPSVNVITIEELAQQLTGQQTIAGLDLGTKTIGISISDLSLSFANPRPLIIRSKFTADAELLQQFAAKEKVAAFIIGLPLNMDGSTGKKVQSTKSFVSNMAKFTDIPFIYWDERLSTVAAERALLERDLSRAKRKTKIDSAAATFILQGALDRLNILYKQNNKLY